MVAADDLSLLRAHAIALSAWSQAVAKATQSQQPANSMQQPAHAVSELQDCGKRLLLAAGSAMQLMREHDLCSCTDEQQLLETMGQLIEPVCNVRACCADSFILLGPGGAAHLCIWEGSSSAMSACTVSVRHLTPHQMRRL
jgi:hypothetical protein